MPDKQDPEPTPTPDPNPDELEAKYWATFESKLNGWFDGKIKELRDTSTSRTGRTTLPGFMANLIFGPEKKD
jgi:hypothetical protein